MRRRRRDECFFSSLTTPCRKMSDVLSLAKEKAISLLQYWGQDDAEFTGRINRLQSQADVVREIEEYFDGGQQAGPYQAVNQHLDQSLHLPQP